LLSFIAGMRASVLGRRIDRWAAVRRSSRTRVLAADLRAYGRSHLPDFSERKSASMTCICKIASSTP
jgi:hypothetical protein